MEIKEIQYDGFGKCVSISNGVIQAIITIDFGPRIISFSRCDVEDQSNVFFEDRERKYSSKGKEFEQLYGEGTCYYAYGGHRIWLSPEDYSRTFYPDNQQVVYSISEEGLTFTFPQKFRAVQASITITMGDDACDMMVIHSGTNISKDMQTASLWPITMVRPGGVALVPQNSRRDGNLLLPNRTISLWAYTDLQDPRIRIGNRYLRLYQNPEISSRLKVGTDCHAGWCLYQSGNLIFTKRFIHNVNAVYPDGGVSFEGFVTGDYMELETLSPLYRIAPGDTVRHVENLSLLYEPDLPSCAEISEDDLDEWLGRLSF